METQQALGWIAHLYQTVSQLSSGTENTRLIFTAIPSTNDLNWFHVLTIFFPAQSSEDTQHGPTQYRPRGLFHGPALWQCRALAGSIVLQ